MVFIVVLLLQLIFVAADQLTQEPESQLLIYVGKKKEVPIPSSANLGEVPVPSSANLGEVPVVNITLLHFFFSGSELLDYGIDENTLA